MKLVKSLLGYRNFWGEDEIKKLITKSKNFDSANESPSSALSLLIFQTSKQQTWIVSSSKRLYCILDDIRKPRPKIQWSSKKQSLSPDGNYESVIVTHPKSEKSGLVDIGTKRRNWLFTKRFFTSSSIEEQIANLLKNT